MHRNCFTPANLWWISPFRRAKAIQEFEVTNQSISRNLPQYPRTIRNPQSICFGWFLVLLGVRWAREITHRPESIVFSGWVCVWEIYQNPRGFGNFSFGEHRGIAAQFFKSAKNAPRAVKKKKKKKKKKSVGLLISARFRVFFARLSVFPSFPPLPLLFRLFSPSFPPLFPFPSASSPRFSLALPLFFLLSVLLSILNDQMP